MGEQDEKENPPSEPQQDTEEPKETDKMLDKKDESSDTAKVSVPKTPDHTEKSSSPPPKSPVNKPKEEKMKEVNGEEIINIPETDNTSPVTQEGREVKPKKIPIGGIKMPGFFTKNKPRTEGDGADGELLENEATENKINEEKPLKEEIKRPTIGERIRNFFNKKQPAKKEDDHVELKNEPTTDGEDPPPKKGLLNAIKLPIANMIPKKRNENGEDVELGKGPATKAGLASMETLDDSLKDQDTVDKAKVHDEGLETVKLTDDKKDDDDEPKQNMSCFDRIKSYRCSKDDIAIAGGIFLFILLVALICIFAFTGKTNLSNAPVRDGRFIEAVTTCGMVEGMMEDAAFAFRGIPYALPPVGENRWKPAQSIEDIENCWNGTLKAHNATDVCSQILGNGTTVGVEDCLTLDVITPYVRYYNPLPVIVLIGAESLSGDAPSLLRPSARFARSRDVIFVRPNFRVGPFGFLSVDALSKSTYPQTSGNYALSDILAALNWIKLNIAHFGGDPKSVTLFGHRAGGTLVSALVTSPKIKGLYTRAWVASGGAVFPGKSLGESERRNHEFTEQIQCNDAECLRNASVDQVLDAVPDTWRRDWPDLPKVSENITARHEWLVLDGEILQQHPADAQEYEPTRLVMGATAHESHSEKLHLKYTEWTPEVVRKHIEDSKIGSRNLTDEAIKRYNSTYQGLVAMISDIRTICPLLTYSMAQRSVLFYVVTQVGGELGIADVNADVLAILGRYEPHTPEQRRYVASIQQVFYHYVSHGELKQFDTRRVIDIGQDALSIEDYPNCNFWITENFVPHYARVD